ncbi:AraC family transcriptional regulator [Amphibacillus sp. Q70]|uniref:AraC family transcriptional regulator n=1 Tax=Amphibacillus sp. Q70 TaxID=3453416 RepID=UPI003F87648D
MAHEFYQMTDKERDSIPFKLLYITRSAYDKGWHSSTHTHHFTELFYIVSGKGSFVLPSHEIPVQKNDLVVINPNVEHTERSNHQDSLKYIALGIEGISFSLTEEDNPYGLFTYKDDEDDILHQLNNLLTEVKDKKLDYERVCRNIIEILITKLIRMKEVTLEKSTGEKINHSIALAQYYITQNFQDPITLDILAKVSNINKYYLAHLFKKEVGMTPIRYLNEVRVKEAKVLLETTDLTIGEIANIAGFSSQSFFTQAFKREADLTPSQFRTLNKRITQ